MCKQLGSYRGPLARFPDTERGWGPSVQLNTSLLEPVTLLHAGARNNGTDVWGAHVPIVPALLRHSGAVHGCLRQLR